MTTVNIENMLCHIIMFDFYLSTMRLTDHISTQITFGKGRDKSLVNVA